MADDSAVATPPARGTLRPIRGGDLQLLRAAAETCDIWSSLRDTESEVLHIALMAPRKLRNLCQASVAWVARTRCPQSLFHGRGDSRSIRQIRFIIFVIVFTGIQINIEKML